MHNFSSYDRAEELAVETRWWLRVTSCAVQARKVGSHLVSMPSRLGAAESICTYAYLHATENVLGSNCAEKESSKYR